MTATQGIDSQQSAERILPALLTIEQAASCLATPA
jgi:hypothetical protein